MFKSFLQFAALVITINALNEPQRWDSFKHNFNKLYNNPLEERTRIAIFQKNLDTIDSHNKKFEEGLVSYKMAVNQFSDLNHSEFVNMMLSVKMINKELKNTNLLLDFPLEAKIPTEIDWNKLGAVTPVKTQGNCGSCWSSSWTFSATGALEGQYFIKYNKSVSLSEQNLVDCASDSTNGSCGGGLMDNAFAYVRDNGIMTEESYPCNALDGQCHFNSSESVLKIKSFHDVKSGSEPQLKAAVGVVGPVSIAMDASKFAFYDKGIFDDSLCGNDGINHCALVVGYGTTEDGIEYWLVKNSWGSLWGENGYIRLSRNKGNLCGVASMASYPIV